MNFAIFCDNSDIRYKLECTSETGVPANATPSCGAATTAEDAGLWWRRRRTSGVRPRECVGRAKSAVPGTMGSRRGNGPPPATSCEGRRASKGRLPGRRRPYAPSTPADPLTPIDRDRLVPRPWSTGACTLTFFSFSVTFFCFRGQPDKKTNTTTDARFFGR